MIRPVDMPDFQNPPVVEVGLSIQFDELQALRTVDAHPIWQLFIDRYPDVSEQSPLMPTFETFGGSFPGQILLQVPNFGIFGAGAMPRYWFLSDDKTNLLQFQRDRLIHNWRRIGPQSVYPRYETIREAFLSEVEQLQGFLADHSLELHLNQCEIVYVNLIELPDEVADPPLARVFQNWRDASAMLPGDLETAAFKVRQVIRDDAGVPIGRFMVDATQPPAHAGPASVQLSLVVRGKPKSPSLEDGLTFLDLGRSMIVKAFTAMTTPEMHEHWGRTV